MLIAKSIFMLSKLTHRLADPIHRVGGSYNWYLTIRPSISDGPFISTGMNSTMNKFVKRWQNMHEIIWERAVNIEYGNIENGYIEFILT